MADAGNSSGEGNLPPNTLLQEGKLYTLNSSPGWRLKGQPLIQRGGKEYRSWNPYTSKLAAFLLQGGRLEGFEHAGEILYLGGSYGTTASHVADITPESKVYCVEISRKPYISLELMAKQHPGIVPILEDASKPENYSLFVRRPEVLIEDIAQKNLLDIMLRNIRQFASIKWFYLAVKARSIDSTADPEAIYVQTMKRLQEELKCEATLRDISVYEADHAIIAGKVL